MEKVKKQIWVLYEKSVENEYMRQLISQAHNIGDMCNKWVVLVAFSDDIDESMNSCKDETDYVLLVHDRGSTIYSRGDIFVNLVEKCTPFLIMATVSEYSRFMVSKVSTGLKIGFVACCIKMRFCVKKEKIIFTRTAIDSSTEVDILVRSYTQLCTVKKNTFQVDESGRMDKVLRIDYYPSVVNRDLKDDNFNIISIKSGEKNDNTRIEDAEIVFGMGKGAIGYIDKICKIAEKYGAAVGCTRALVDDGYFSKAHQIGQSGKHIKARVYVAFGISGASQHLMGIANAHKIVAITNDDKAPIINYCDYAYIADIEDVLSYL